MKEIQAIADVKTVQRAENKGKVNSGVGEIAFVETVSQAVRLGKIVIPTKSETTEICFERNKMVNFDDVRWDEEEEKINAFITRLQKILKKGGEKNE